ncbi:MAG: M1 family metallopeptidase [Bacteroidota bacterium]
MSGASVRSILFLAFAVVGCSPDNSQTESSMTGRDIHSFAKPDEVVVTHLDLDLNVNFEAKVLAGTATLKIKNKTGTHQLHLDIRELTIHEVTLNPGASTAQWTLGTPVPHMGQELVVTITPGTESVSIRYTTSPNATALQWLAPAQTAGKRKPFLFTQSQAILARTWVPCQDGPGVRMTYSATVRVPKDLMAVMSAENPTKKTRDGVYTFAMPQPIPSYLLALAVGDLEFRPLGKRSGVYAEPPVAAGAAWELADTEKMIEAAEALYGPYRWERYDVIILPPSFPFGGMENPRLTFATPTILAGDRSLVSLVAHELAHSWSGNLVTNATWNDFWLNEGFTTYFEHRIMEEVYGKSYAEMLSHLSLQDLQTTIADLGPDHRDTHLYLDLKDRDPDDGVTDVAYNKGYLFLRLIEETVGREQWDAFLRTYFETFAFQSMTTSGFLGYLKEHLLKGDKEREERIGIDRWVYGPGLPDNVPTIRSEEFARVESQIARWNSGTAAMKLDTAGWTTHHWLHFLKQIPPSLESSRLAELDKAFTLTSSGNSEILNAWFLHAIGNNYQPAYPALEKFLTTVGRRKFLKPLYTKLAETPSGLERAKRIYTRARPTYHSVSSATIDGILKWEQ